MHEQQSSSCLGSTIHSPSGPDSRNRSPHPGRWVGAIICPRSSTLREVFTAPQTKAVGENSPLILPTVPKLSLQGGLLRRDEDLKAEAQSNPLSPLVHVRLNFDSRRLSSAGLHSTMARDPTHKQTQRGSSHVT